MLRSVSFKNFVKFKEYQRLEFRDGGPFLFIGENGSGKSAVLEGIRRSLSAKLSTTVSSQFDPNQLSFFICDFDLCNKEKENVKCGFISLPKISKPGKESVELNNEKEFSEKIPVDNKCQNDHTESDDVINQEEGDRIGASCERKKSDDKETEGSYYKFATKLSEGSDNELMYAELVTYTKTADGVLENINLEEKYTNQKSESKSFLNFISQNSTDESIKDSFESIIWETNTESLSCKMILESLTKNVVFTFPLRSIGPLQWSESKRIRHEERDKNYTEAESRCEIIRYFLNDPQKRFDHDKENEYFYEITQRKDVNFVLEDGKVVLDGKGKYALLKTPEGILEAKHFSILMSCNDYKTVILEEPERGMHPQFIMRMLQIMIQKTDEKVVILTTHNRTLLSPWTMPGCFVFKHTDVGCRVISCNSIFSEADKAENVNLKELRKMTSDHVADVLFAKKVMFYEGESEWLFLTELKHQILLGKADLFSVFCGDQQIYNRLKHRFLEMTLINMHGKGSFKFCQKICKNLGLEPFFVGDRDLVEDILNGDKTEEVKQAEKQARMSWTRTQWLSCRQRYLTTHNVFFWLDGTIEDMLIVMSENNKPLYEKLKKHLKGFPNREKKFLLSDFGCNDLRESVKAVLEYSRIEDDLVALFMQLIGERDNDM